MADITQVKGKTVVIYGDTIISDIDKENSITYNIGQRGETYGTLTSILHVLENAGSIVSEVVINVPKGSAAIPQLLIKVASNAVFPFVINDSGMGINVGMVTANITQVAMSATTGDSSKETMSFSFKGNLALVAV
jgi:hypothetical protein